MVLGLTTAQLTELGLAANNFGHLIELRFTGGTLYYTDRPHDVVYGGNTYGAAGNVLGIDDIEESMEPKAAEYQLSLSGVNTANIAAALSAFSLNRVGIIYRALFNASNQTIDNPFVIARGVLDAYALSENEEQGESAFDVKLVNHWADFDRVAGRITNDKRQQVFYPGDRGFEFAGDLNDSSTFARL